MTAEVFNIAMMFYSLPFKGTSVPLDGRAREGGDGFIVAPNIPIPLLTSPLKGEVIEAIHQE